MLLWLFFAMFGRLGGAGGWKGGGKNEISSNDKMVVFVLVPTVEIFVCEQEMRKIRLRCHCSGGLKLSPVLTWDLRMSSDSHTILFLDLAPGLRSIDTSERQILCRSPFLVSERDITKRAASSKKICQLREGLDGVLVPDQNGLDVTFGQNLVLGLKK